MSSQYLKICICTGIALLTACTPDATAPTMAAAGKISRAVSSLPTINVSTIDSLYAVVNNPLNVGRDVRLSPTTYVLDPSRPNHGRLELQQDMTLRGKAGYAATVIIDASQLQPDDYKDDTLTPAEAALVGPTGAIRVGRGTNTIESLTIRNAKFGAAGIETDLVGTGPTSIRIAHVIASGSPRGIEVRNVGTAMANRALVVELSDNELVDNTLVPGTGLQITNRSEANGATIDATIDNNKAHGNVAGCLMANLGVSGARITVDSHADRFERNGNGCVIFGGRGAANNNTISFRAGSSRFVDNSIPLAPSPRADSGAIIVVGGEGGLGASDNTVVVDLWGILFDGNRCTVDEVDHCWDIKAYGVLSVSGPPPTGTGNHVTIMLHGMSNTAAVDSSSTGTNTVTVTHY